MYAFLFILTVEKQRQKEIKECKFNSCSQMQYSEDTMFCLIRFLVLLMQTSDTSDLFCTFNIPKFKKGCTKRSHYRNTAECNYSCSGRLVTLGRAELFYTATLCEPESSTATGVLSYT